MWLVLPLGALVALVVVAQIGTVVYVRKLGLPEMVAPVAKPAAATHAA